MWRRGPFCSPLPEGIPSKEFSAGKFDICHYSVEEGPMCFNCRELGHTAILCPKLRQLND